VDKVPPARTPCKTFHRHPESNLRIINEVNCKYVTNYVTKYV
jgi:hypothetical protein